MALRDRLLTFLEAYWETHGYGPTLEEIRRHVGLSSRSHVLYHLRALAQEGRVQQEPGKHRTWRPTDRSASRISIPLKGVVPPPIRIRWMRWCRRSSGIYGSPPHGSLRAVGSPSGCGGTP
jgi:SOS-response transcriptional repressor LexA